MGSRVLRAAKRTPRRWRVPWLSKAAGTVAKAMPPLPPLFGRVMLPSRRNAQTHAPCENERTTHAATVSAREHAVPLRGGAVACSAQRRDKSSFKTGVLGISPRAPLKIPNMSSGPAAE